MKTIVVDRNGGIPWTQTIYQTQQLTNENGRAPERVVARQVSSSLDDIGVDHVIHYDFPPVSIATQRPNCSLPPEAHSVDVGDPTDGPLISDPPQDSSVDIAGHRSARVEFEEYLFQNEAVEAVDSNLILTTSNDGGCATVGGNTASAGGGGIESDPGELLVRGRDERDRSIHSAMHEIAHNMGNSHEENAGMSWNGPEYWHTTPAAARNSAFDVMENMCGESVGPRDRQSFIDELYYHDCQAAQMEVVPKPEAGDMRFSGSAEADFVAGDGEMDVRFNGLYSDGGEAILSYEWDFGDGDTGSGPVVSHTYSGSGQYTATLTVRGLDGTEDSVTKTICTDPAGCGGTGNGGNGGGGGGGRGGVGAAEVATAGGIALALLVAVDEETREQIRDAF